MPFVIIHLQTSLSFLTGLSLFITYKYSALHAAAPYTQRDQGNEGAKMSKAIFHKGA